MSALVAGVSGVLTVGYWSIRGLGAPLRMMTMYAEQPFQCELYYCTPTEGGGFDREAWMVRAKPELKLKQPLINLPYIEDGEGFIVTQSNACMLYLGRRFNMLGDGSPAQLSQCEMLLCETMDLRNQVVGYVYSHRGSSAEETGKFFAGVRGILEKLEAVLATKEASCRGLPFLVGGKASAPDFHLWELLDQIQQIATVHKLPSPVDSDFPHLSKFRTDFAALPGNAKYLASPLSRLPANNLMAKVASVPDGQAFEHGMEITWAGLSGKY